jgi:hypothetical protein
MNLREYVKLAVRKRASVTMRIDMVRQEVMDHAYIKRHTGHYVQRWPGEVYHVRVAGYRCRKNCLHAANWIEGRNYGDALHNAALYVLEHQSICGCQLLV